MNEALELIQFVEAAGGRFLVDGERLGIVPRGTAAPVINELRQHKTELLAELARRPPCLPVSGLSRGPQRQRRSNCRSAQPSQIPRNSSARR